MTGTKLKTAVGVCVTGLSLSGSAWAGGAPSAVAVAGASHGGQTRQEVGESRPEETGRASEASRASEAAATPVFVPRARRGSPAARVGGATRSRGDELVVRTLVPRLDESAIALAPNQTLYWHLSTRTDHAVNFTLTDPEAIDPILDVTLEGPFEAGIHAVDVSAHGAELEIGRRYEWYVAVVPDPARRSADIIARGAIERVAEPSLQSRLAGLSPEQAAVLLAEQGIWYDALDAVTKRIATSPGDPALLAQRSALLQQVGLELTSEAD